MKQRARQFEAIARQLKRHRGLVKELQRNAKAVKKNAGTPADDTTRALHFTRKLLEQSAEVLNAANQILRESLAPRSDD